MSLLAGDESGALSRLGRLAATYPLRERLRALQMLALYRSGRQAEALGVFEDTRRLLRDELGVEPGRPLQLLHRQVLDQNPSLDHAVVGRPDAPDRLVTRAVGTQQRRPSFVGRGDAMVRLERAIADARDGQTRIVLIDGEPGIGKTSLVNELTARPDNLGMHAVWGRCHDDEGAPALWPWVQILRGLGVGDHALSDRLRSVLATLLPELGAAPETELGPDAARFRLYDAIREGIDQTSRNRPTVIVLDDLQWADRSSLRLLRFLAVEVRDAPIAIVATFRNTEELTKGDLADSVADIVRRPDVERLSLTGLPLKDVAEMLRRTTDLSSTDVDDTAARLHQRTNGNPFFLIELIRLMESEGQLAAGAASVDVPTAVSDVIRRRMGRLPDEVQTVLGVGAVIGRQFELDVLAHACGLDADRTLEALEAALATRIVVELGTGRYEFTHALVTETLYADLTPARRVRLHGRVAEAIDSVWAADPEAHYHELAYHYGRGAIALNPSAVLYARLAADQATRRQAYDEAVVQWRHAVDAVDRFPGAAPAERARLLLELAAAERRAGNMGSSSAVHDRALAIAQRSGDRELLAETALAYGEVGLWQVRRYGTVDERVVSSISEALVQLPPGDSTMRVRLLTGLVVATYYREGERQHGLALVREAIAMARRLGEGDLLATSLVKLVVMLDAVPDQTEQLASVAELRGLPAGNIHPEIASAIGIRLARVALASGDASTLTRDIDAFAKRAITHRYPDDRLWTTWAQASIAFLHDRLDDAERLAGEAFALHEQLGIWGAHETYALHMLLVWREQGRLRAVEPVVDPLLAAAVHPSAPKMRAIFAVERGAIHEIATLLGPDPVPRSRDFTWMVDVCITAELAAMARLPCRHELYQTLMPFKGRVVTMDGTFICFGAASYYLGLLAASLGWADRAHDHFDAAIDLNDAIGAIPWSRRARAARRAQTPLVT